MDLKVSDVLNSDIISKENKKILLFRIFQQSILNRDITKQHFESHFNDLCKPTDICKIFFPIIKAITICLDQEQRMKDKIVLNELYNIDDKYQNILDETCKLAQELKLQSSLQYSNLFTYMLWNGYFSDKNILKAGKVDKILLPGLASYNIMRGDGVCYNFSSMLRDFLNNAGYSCELLSNNLPQYKLNYNVCQKRSFMDNLDDLITICKKQKNVTYYVNYRKINIPVKLLNKNDIGTHSFNLILDDNMLYVYDPTNIFIGKLEEDLSVKIIEGEGNVPLCILNSYMLDDFKNNHKLLDMVLTSKNFDYDYPRNFSEQWYEDLEKFNNNKQLFKDFHSDVSNDIFEISKVFKKQN